MAIIMNMSSYVIEHTTAKDSGHNVEMLLSSSNRALEMAIQHHEANPKNRYESFPANLATVDVEFFLQKMIRNRC